MATKKAVATVSQLHSALWATFELDWKLKPHQKAVYDIFKAKSHVPSERFLWNMSRRWGKTFVLSIIAIEHALKNKNAYILFTASEQRQVLSAVKPAFDEIFKDCPASLRPKYNRNASIYTFPNGSQIAFSGMDGGRVQKRRGLTANLVICDEAGFCEDLKVAVESVLSPMLATTRGQMILASNSPRTPDHEFITVFKRQAEIDGNYLVRTIFDSDFTPEEIAAFAKQSGGLESSTFKREYLCAIEIDHDRALVPEFGEMKSLIVKEWTRPEFYTAMVAIDLGFIDFTGVLFMYVDFLNAKVVICDELIFKSQNSKVVTDACKAKEAALWPYVRPSRLADGQLYTLNDLSTVHNYPVVPAMKPGVEAQVNTLRNEVKSGNIIIDPKCVQLIHQLETGVWNKAKTAFSRTASEGHNDLISCLSYGLRQIDRHTNPFPRNFGFDPYSSRIRAPQLNASMEAIKKLFTPKL